MVQNQLGRKINKSKAFVERQIRIWRNTYEPTSDIDLTVFEMQNIFWRCFNKIKTEGILKKIKKKKN